MAIRPLTLFKAHGLGNDYLVLESGNPLDAALVRALCDRHRGPGGDGILEPIAAVDADHGVRIWNPDGSVAEKSGNGLRIFAWWLSRAGEGSPTTVWTGYDVVECWVDGADVRVDMGAARFAPDRVPVVAEGELVDHALNVAGQAVEVTVLSLGNPHCVLFFTEDLDTVPWRRLGRELEVHPMFPNRTNVQFARVVGQSVQLRIWERGAGETQASGSSACAAVAAAVRTGRLESGRIPVQMPGGTLYVTPGSSILLEGPVEPVGRFEVDASWLTSRTSQLSPGA